MVTVKQLEEAYPGAVDAVLWSEAVLFGGDGGGDTIIRPAVAAGDLTLDTALEAVRFVFAEQQTAEEMPPNCRLTAGRALACLDHPDYRRYLASKLGMM